MNIVFALGGNALLQRGGPPDLRHPFLPGDLRHALLMHRLAASAPR